MGNKVPFGEFSKIRLDKVTFELMILGKEKLCLHQFQIRFSSPIN